MFHSGDTEASEGEGAPRPGTRGQQPGRREGREAEPRPWGPLPLPSPRPSSGPGWIRFPGSWGQVQEGVGAGGKASRGVLTHELLTQAGRQLLFRMGWAVPARGAQMRGPGQLCAVRGTPGRGHLRVWIRVLEPCHALPWALPIG